MNQPTDNWQPNERCKQKVWPNGQFTSHRCSRKAVKDGYCNQHHPDTVKERDEKQRLKFQERIDKHPLTVAHKKIEELKQQHDDLQWALKQIADLDAKNGSLVTAIFMAKEAIAKVTK